MPSMALNSFLPILQTECRLHDDVLIANSSKVVKPGADPINNNFSINLCYAHFRALLLVEILE